MRVKKYLEAKNLLKDGDFDEQTIELIEKEKYTWLVWYGDGTLYGMKGGTAFFILDNLGFPESEV